MWLPQILDVATSDLRCGYLRSKMWLPQVLVVATSGLRCVYLRSYMWLPIMAIHLKGDVSVFVIRVTLVNLSWPIHGTISMLLFQFIYWKHDTLPYTLREYSSSWAF